MRNFIFSCTTMLCMVVTAVARNPAKLQPGGIYLQWGYNLERYSRSDIHFKDGSNFEFTLLDAKAHDKPDFTGLRSNPFQLTIPQYSFRVGLYLNEKHTRSIEWNYDHTKYVMTDWQTLRITGHLFGRTIDKDTLINPDFIHFEHTNGANFHQINYCGLATIWKSPKRESHHLTLVYKAGAGVVVPKSDVTLMGLKRDNRFHIAGYVISAEVGLRYYPLKKLSLELTGKTGFANYMNVLTVGDARARHYFFYREVIGLVGYDINLPKRVKKDDEK